MRLVIGLPVLYTFKCISYISEVRNLNYFENMLSTSLLIHYVFRILFITYFTIYILISASRTLMFVSPSTFVSAKTTLWKFISMPILLVVLACELILSGIVISPQKCQIDQNGFKLWDLAFTIFHDQKNISIMPTEESNFTIFNESHLGLSDDLTLLTSNSKNATMSESTSQVCLLFPTLRILLSTIIVLETVRCIAAAIRNLNRIKQKAKKVGTSIPLKAVNRQPSARREMRSSSIQQIVQIVSDPIRRKSLPTREGFTYM